VAELKERNERIRLLEADLAAAKRTPQEVAELTAHADPLPGRRDVFQELFQDRGMEFELGEAGRSGS
jgi:hypothetical protein